MKHLDFKPGFGEGFAKHLPEMDGHNQIFDQLWQNLLKTHPGAVLGWFTVLGVSLGWETIKAIPDGTLWVFLGIFVIGFTYWALPHHKKCPTPILFASFAVTFAALTSYAFIYREVFPVSFLITSGFIVLGASIYRRKHIIAAYENGSFEGRKMGHFQTPGESLKVWGIAILVAAVGLIGLHIYDAPFKAKYQRAEAKRHIEVASKLDQLKSAPPAIPK